MLSREEIDAYHTKGYLGPYTLCSPEEMAELRPALDEVLNTAGPNPRSPRANRFLDKRVVYELCAHPAIVERCAALLGRDLILWASFFFGKDPGGKEIPWHQDLTYWPIHPLVAVSSWLAIDDATVENSCVHILPKSHRRILGQVKSPPEMEFPVMSDLGALDMSGAKGMEMKAGQFFMFSPGLLHQSNANHSNRRRLGMTVRMSVPSAKVFHDDAQLHAGHKVMLVRGEDHYKLNSYGAIPND